MLQRHPTRQCFRHPLSARLSLKAPQTAQQAGLTTRYFHPFMHGFDFCSSFVPALVDFPTQSHTQLHPFQNCRVNLKYGANKTYHAEGDH